MIYRNSFDKLEQSLHLFIWMTYCRVDVIQRTVFEGFELSEKLCYTCVAILAWVEVFQEVWENFPPN